MIRTHSVLALALLTACAPQPSDLERATAMGQAVSATVEEQPDGSLYAKRLHVSETAEDDEDSIPLEDLPAAVADAMEAEWPGATWLSAEKEEGTYEVEFITTAGEHLEAEFAKDGELLEWEAEDEEDEEDEDEMEDEDEDEMEDEDELEDAEDEDEEDLSAAALFFVTGVPDLVDDVGTYKILGLEVQSRELMPHGIVRIDGAYRGQQTLTSTRIEATDGEPRVGGVSQGLQGNVLTLMDLPILVDDQTEIVWVSNPMERD